MAVNGATGSETQAALCTGVGAERGMAPKVGLYPANWHASLIDRVLSREEYVAKIWSIKKRNNV